MTRLLRPGALHELRIEHFLPPVEALHVCSPLEELGCRDEVGEANHSESEHLLR